MVRFSEELSVKTSWRRWYYGVDTRSESCAWWPTPRRMLDRCLCEFLWNTDMLRSGMLTPSMRGVCILKIQEVWEMEWITQPQMG